MPSEHPFPLEHQHLPAHRSLVALRSLMLRFVGAAKMHEHRNAEPGGGAPQRVELGRVERNEHSGAIDGPVVGVVGSRLILDLEAHCTASHGILEHTGDPLRVIRSRLAKKHVLRIVVGDVREQLEATGVRIRRDPLRDAVAEHAVDQ